MCLDKTLTIADPGWLQMSETFHHKGRKENKANKRECLSLRALRSLRFSICVHL